MDRALHLDIEDLESMESPSAAGDFFLGVGAGALAAGAVVAGVVIFT